MIFFLFARHCGSGWPCSVSGSCHITQLKWVLSLLFLPFTSCCSEYRGRAAAVVQRRVFGSCVSSNCFTLNYAFLQSSRDSPQALGWISVPLLVPVSEGSTLHLFVCHWRAGQDSSRAGGAWQVIGLRRDVWERGVNKLWRKKNYKCLDFKRIKGQYLVDLKPWSQLFLWLYSKDWVRIVVSHSGWMCSNNRGASTCEQNRWITCIRDAGWQRAATPKTLPTASGFSSGVCFPTGSWRGIFFFL